ncbi:hypothetical protein ACIP6V_23840 [Streptomyces sp. NPDC088770]|uniref:hypothetical protein n=1 Tax=unclassified Streptomyces TaxID=2593676 RepID=UPI002DDC5AC5|nr:hypothetical protein [Streptomyces sp. NBC_01788]WSB29709.1 hypothetical protein OIE49_29600 [Streptomyces sp. NBC_01788]
MANDQMHLPQGEEEIIQQVEAYTMAGITRAMLRGCIDRGELRIADHKGSRGSARLFRADVARLMAEKGWRGPSPAVSSLPQQTVGDICRRRECAEGRDKIRALEEEQRQDAETIRRMRIALNALTS